MEWYYAQAEQSVGPFDETTIQKLLTAGVISQETLVFNSQMPAWAPLSDCMPTPESPAPPESAKSEIQAPSASEDPNQRQYPRKALYAIACMVMAFVIPGLDVQIFGRPGPGGHSILICFLTLALGFAAVELCHRALRDVTLGLAGARHKRSVTVILVCIYVLLALL